MSSSPQTNLLRLSWRKPCSCHRWGHHNGSRTPRLSRSGRSSGEERRTPWGRCDLCQPQTCNQNTGEYERASLEKIPTLWQWAKAYLDKSALSLTVTIGRIFFLLHHLFYCYSTCVAQKHTLVIYYHKFQNKFFLFLYSPNHKAIAVHSAVQCRSLRESNSNWTGSMMTEHGVGKSDERQQGGQQAGR